MNGDLIKWLKFRRSFKNVKMCGICCFSIQKDNLQIENRQNSSLLFRRKFVAVKIGVLKIRNITLYSCSRLK